MNENLSIFRFYLGYKSLKKINLPERVAHHMRKEMAEICGRVH